jgi:hypothetical protein
VKHRDPAGRTRRGLHILRSDTDQRSMKLGGNLLTHYRHRLASINLRPTRDQLAVRIATPGAGVGLDVLARLSGQPAPLAPGSPFRSRRDARRFAGPLPWTFVHRATARRLPDRHRALPGRGELRGLRPRRAALPAARHLADPGHRGWPDPGEPDEPHPVRNPGRVPAMSLLTLNLTVAGVLLAGLGTMLWLYLTAVWTWTLIAQH